MKLESKITISLCRFQNVVTVLCSFYLKTIECHIIHLSVQSGMFMLTLLNKEFWYLLNQSKWDPNYSWDFRYGVSLVLGLERKNGLLNSLLWPLGPPWTDLNICFLYSSSFKAPITLGKFPFLNHSNFYHSYCWSNSSSWDFFPVCSKYSSLVLSQFLLKPF